MATGDVTQAVAQANQDKAETQADAKTAYRGAGEDGTTACEENEKHRSDAFCNQFFHTQLKFNYRVKRQYFRERWRMRRVLFFNKGRERFVF